MLSRRLVLAVLTIACLAQFSFALEFEQFRQAAQAYEARMMQNVGTITITGTRTTWQNGTPRVVNVTIMRKGDKWRIEERSQIQHDGHIIIGDATDSEDSRLASLGTDPVAQPAAVPVPQKSAPPAPPAKVDTTARAAKTVQVQSVPAQPAIQVIQPAPVAQPAPVVNPPVAQPATQPPASAVSSPPHARPRRNNPPSTSGNAPAPSSVPVLLPSGGSDGLPATPDSVVAVTIFDGEMLSQSFNGTLAWSHRPTRDDPKPPTIPGHDYWYDLTDSTVVTGSEMRRTRHCWVLENDSVRLWIDNKDFFLVARERKRPQHAETELTECSNFFGIGDGYTVPSRIDRYIGDYLAESAYISNVYFNRPIDDSQFQVSSDQIQPPASAPAQDKRPGERKR